MPLVLFHHGQSLWYGDDWFVKATVTILSLSWERFIYKSISKKITEIKFESHSKYKNTKMFGIFYWLFIGHWPSDVTGYRDHVEQVSGYKGAWCNRRSTWIVGEWGPKGQILRTRSDSPTPPTSSEHSRSLKHIYQNRNSYNCKKWIFLERVVRTR